MGTTRKEPVRLRQRITPSGLTSLYLDIYYKGRREYEYLRMYLVPEHSRADKEQNRETLKFAEAICAKRIVELRNGIYGFKKEKTAAETTSFFDFLSSCIEKRREMHSAADIWRALLNRVRQYEKRKDIMLADITQDWVKGFRAFLDKVVVFGIRPLSQNTKLLYFRTLHTCLREAMKEHIITEDATLGVDAPKREEVNRMYLTIDEVRQLASTPCRYEGVRRAFLFSCLTGLRRSDIERLTWGDVHQQGDYTRIIFRQKKTKGQEYLDINPQAVSLMGQRGNAEDCIFNGFLQGNNTNRYLQEWVTNAGISKKITFHCGRHTFAVMMLDLGTDIYTVSKLLGHRELSTTQIYAKVLDKNKQKAVLSIPDILDCQDAK